MRGRLHIPLLVCAFALILGGCGSDDNGTIPSSDADNLLNQLEAVQSDVRNGDCETARQHAQEFVTGVNLLPNGVANEVASELTKAAANLSELTVSDCEEGASGITGLETTDTTETDTTATETTEPETTTTTTTEPDTTAEQDTTQEPPQDEPLTPPSGGNQGGGGGPAGSPTPGGGAEPPSGGITPGGG